MDVEQFDREKMINAIWQEQGNVTAAARMLGCSTRTIHNYAEKYKTVKDAIGGARQMWDEDLVDEAELVLRSLVLKDKRAWAVKYVLDTKGVKRGYGKRLDVTSGGEKLAGPTIYLPQVEEDEE